MEKWFRAVSYIVRNLCICGKGEFRATGKMDMSALPPLYEHKCDGCGLVMYWSVSYPDKRVVEEDSEL